MALKTIVITGTHLTPALALLEKLRPAGWRTVFLVRQKLSPKILPKDVSVIPIASTKFQRFNWVYSVFTGIRFPLGFFQSLVQLRRLKPAVVLSFGGYIAVPVCYAAKFLRIPLVIHEQTTAAGLANKLTAPLATKIAISWPSSRSSFPERKTILTGNPIRSCLLKPSRPVTSLELGPSQLPLIYFTGGSQGSRFLNQTLNHILLPLLKKYRLVHQFGLNQTRTAWQKQLERRRQLPAKLRQNYQLKRWYLDQDLAAILRQASLVVGRAGINTVTELALLAKASLLIPLTITQKEEQQRNAQFLVDLGLAKILPQASLTPQTLLSQIEFMLSHQDQFQLKKTVIDLPLIRRASQNLYRLVSEVSRGQ